MVEQEKEEAEVFMEKVMEKVHGRFINESDVPETGIEGYRNFVNNYIKYRYQPLIEEYDEARYQTYMFDNNLIKKSKCRPGKSISSISLK